MDNKRHTQQQSPRLLNLERSYTPDLTPRKLRTSGRSSPTRVSPYGYSTYYDDEASLKSATSSPERPSSPSRPNRFVAEDDVLSLRKSSNNYLRTLGDSTQDVEELSIPGVTTDVEDVAGLAGRIRLQANIDSTDKLASVNLLDKSRKTLQAYEYLCRVGEAKEWIEACIKEEIPPIVKLEQGLRDGVILAKLTKVFAPSLVGKIFQAPRLQWRHSENINYFFKFMKEVNIPDLFSFELTDLYDKKNVPKVIYCIHALSFILASQGRAPLIGDLFGKLEFSDAELATTQGSLDAAGFKIPNFGGMNKQFNVESDPYQSQLSPSRPPALTDSEIRQRRLREMEKDIITLQSISRGCLARKDDREMRLGLATARKNTIALQSKIRGNDLRKTFNFRIDDIAIQADSIPELQSVIRGHLVRQRYFILMRNLLIGRSSTIKLQSAIRGGKARLGSHKSLQALANQENEKYLCQFQTHCRAFLCRKHYHRLLQHLKSASSSVSPLQAITNGNRIRHDIKGQLSLLACQESVISRLQASARGFIYRRRFSDFMHNLSNFDTDRIIKLQARCRAVLLRWRCETLLQALDCEEDKIVVLQSHIRRKLLDGDFTAFKEETDFANASTIRLQSRIRGEFVRFEYDQLLSILEATASSSVVLQAQVRGMLVRRKFERQMKHYLDNLDKVIKVQSLFRARRQGSTYKLFTSSSNPPLATVKNFVNLLSDSDLDFEQEIELENTRKKVANEIHKNDMLEQYIDELDVKIALLVKNKITLDEVIRHQHLGIKTNLPSEGIMDFHVLNKAARRQLDLYQGLFYILQAQPEYLARLFSQTMVGVLPEKEAKSIERIIIVLFGSVQKRREEFLLLKLIVRSVQEDISVSSSLDAFLVSSSITWRLLTTQARRAKERPNLTTLLQPLFSEVLDAEDVNLESDPMTIYQSSINQEEVVTGRPSNRDPDVPVDLAIQDSDTRATFVSNLQQLREVAANFIDHLESKIGIIPYSIRIIAKEAYQSAQDRFPREPIENLYACIGNVVYNKYLSAAVLAPDSFGLYDTAISPIQRKNLTEINKVLAQIFSAKLFGNDNVFLQPLNDFLDAAIKQIHAILLRIIDVTNIEQQYEMSIFGDLIGTQRPTLYLKAADILSVHDLVFQNLEVMTLGRKCPLSTIVQELGPAPEESQGLLTATKYTEVKLDLNPIYCGQNDPDAEVKNSLFEAKRCLIYVIKVQTGKDLLDVLLKPVQEGDEQRYRQLISSDHSSKAMKTAYAEGVLGDLSKLTYRQLKALALEKILQLESKRQISRSTGYQEILNSIARDIKNKRDLRLTRARELEGMSQTLSSLASKEAYLQTQMKSYNDYIEQCMVTLQSKKSKRKGILPFTRQFFHMRDLQKNGKVPKFGSFKYSASDLMTKGILLKLDGYSDKQLDKVYFTFSSDKVGIFNVEGTYGSVAFPGGNSQITLDQLLSQQYNNQQYFDIFDGKAKVHTNLLLHFIFRKFYRDGA